MIRLRLALTSTAFGALLFSGPVRADATATAQELFDRGLSEMKAEHFSVGCPALRESYRLDPQPGTLFTLAECEARAGLVASALAHFDAYIESVDVLTEVERERQASRVAAARARRDELRPQVPHLTLVVPESAPADAVLRLGDSVVPRVNWNVALPTDPGAYAIRLELADGRSTSAEVKLTPGDSVALAVALPSPAPPAPVPLPAPRVAPQPEKAPEPAAPARPLPLFAAPPPASGPRVSAYVALGLGAAGIVTGSVAGAILISKRNTVSGHCDGKLCDSAGYATTRNVSTLDTVANVGFGVGLVGIAVGVVLLVTDHRATSAARSQPGIALGPHTGSATWSGTF